jgi:hypothetical protein
VFGVECTFCVNTLFGTPGGTQPNKFKMPEIADLMDVNLEDLSPEQRQQL